MRGVDKKQRENVKGQQRMAEQESVRACVCVREREEQRDEGCVRVRDQAHLEWASSSCVYAVDVSLSSSSTARCAVDMVS
jgi:hypothetical protein